MAETVSSENKAISRVQKLSRPASSKGKDSKAERSQCPDRRPVSCPSNKSTVDLFAKEEHYKLLNAELEAKTAELVRQAEQIMREQNEVLSKPVSSHLVIGSDDDMDLRTIKTLEPIVPQPGVKVVTNKRATSQNRPPGNRRKVQHDSFKRLTPKVSLVDDVAVVEDIEHFSLAKTICSAERRLDDGDGQENDVDDMSSAGDDMGADAPIHFLKATLCIMQDELNRLSYECNQKDDENNRLGIKIKEAEEDRARLQRNTNIQQMQIEKHRALAEESNKKSDGLQQLVSALQKETEALRRAQKQAASNQSSVEVRLNRALEEVERLKSQLNKTKQMNKDKTGQEHQKKETLLAENKTLEKQKAELIVGFKKQLKLIDILKRQKMHFEAAKMLSFTEEEFMKALDWGKS